MIFGRAAIQLVQIVGPIANEDRAHLGQPQVVLRQHIGQEAVGDMMEVHVVGFAVFHISQIVPLPQHAAEAAERRSQVGSGDRSERIRTYNFPQGRVTDHRINLTMYSLDRFMEGEIESMVEALASAAQADALKAELGG